MIGEMVALGHHAYEPGWRRFELEERRSSFEARLKGIRVTARWTALIVYARYQRWWQNVAVSAVMGLVGWAAVVLIVNHFDTSGVYTRWAVSGVFVLPTYLIHRWLWKDRKTPAKSSGWRWMVLWAFSHADMLTYWALVNYIGIQYIAAAYINTVPSTLILYRVRDKFVFLQNKAEAA